MSKRNLNGQQFQLFHPGPLDFSRSPEHGPWQHEAPTYEHQQKVKAAQGEQLDMIRPLRRVIDEAHKIDSPHHPDKGGSWSPRDQWERPGSGSYLSLRDLKLRMARVGGNAARWGGRNEGSVVEGVQQDKVLPVTLYKDPFTGRETVADGHHRLAAHEHLGHTEIPIKHRKERQWGESYP